MDEIINPDRLVSVPFNKTRCGVDFYINTAINKDIGLVLHGVGDGRCAVREHDGVIVERDGVIARCADAVGRGRAREQDGLHAEAAQNEVKTCVKKR